MPLINLRACLTLGALLCSLPVLADAPAAPIAGEMHWQTLLLQHVVPGDILKTLHWDKAAGLPAGVTNVYALQSNNSLLVRATPAGFTQVRDLVRALDVEPRRVQIRFALANAIATDLKASGIRFDLIPYPIPPHPAESDLGYAAGSVVAPLLQKLTKKGVVTLGPVVTTSNNVNASVSLSGGQPLPALPDVEALTFAATPRVNSDDTVTLVLHPQATWRVAGKTNPDGTPATATGDIESTRTVRSGDTLVFTNLFHGAAGSSQLLLFVTPTLLSGGSGPAAMMVK